MSVDLSGSNYSEVDASNSNAAPNGMPEGMSPSGVNDAWRQSMGAIKRAFDRDHAGTWCTVGGTANALTLTYTTGPAAYVQGEKFSFKATAANTGATTVNVSGLGVKNVFRKTGAGVAACLGGEIQSGDIVELEYDGTQFQIIGGAASVAKQPTRQVLTSGTAATYTTPTGATRINVRMVGGGGGGGGSAASGAGNGGNGTASTWSGGSLSAGGGIGGPVGTALANAGGTAANGDININGSSGGNAPIGTGVGGAGAPGLYGMGGGVGGGASGNGGGAAANSGGGGGGGGSAGGAQAAAGGSGGAYVEKQITSPASSYTYTVGAAGAAGASGTGSAGGVGAAGIIIVDEFYN